MDVQKSQCFVISSAGKVCIFDIIVCLCVPRTGGVRRLRGASGGLLPVLQRYLHFTLYHGEDATCIIIILFWHYTKDLFIVHEFHFTVPAQAIEITTLRHEHCVGSLNITISMLIHNEVSKMILNSINMWPLVCV